MFKIIKILLGYIIIIVVTAVFVLLVSLSGGWFLNWLVPAVDLGLASILSSISLICGARMVFFFSGLKSSHDDSFEDEDAPSEVVYLNPTIINRKRRKPRR